MQAVALVDEFTSNAAVAPRERGCFVPALLEVRYSVRCDLPEELVTRLSPSDRPHFSWPAHQDADHKWTSSLGSAWRPGCPGAHSFLERRLQHPAATQLAGLPDPGQVRRRVCGFRLGQGLGSSLTRWFPWSPLFLNPHIAWYMKPNSVNGSGHR